MAGVAVDGEGAGVPGGGRRRVRGRPVELDQRRPPPAGAPRPERTYALSSLILCSFQVSTTLPS